MTNDQLEIIAEMEIARYRDDIIAERLGVTLQEMLTFRARLSRGAAFEHQAVVARWAPKPPA
jgi:hypothetical protein